MRCRTEEASFVAGSLTCITRLRMYSSGNHWGCIGVRSGCVRMCLFCCCSTTPVLLLLPLRRRLRLDCRNARQVRERMSVQVTVSYLSKGASLQPPRSLQRRCPAPSTMRLETPSSQPNTNIRQTRLAQIPRSAPPYRPPSARRRRLKQPRPRPPRTASPPRRRCRPSRSRRSGCPSGVRPAPLWARLLRAGVLGSAVVAV